MCVCVCAFEAHRKSRKIYGLHSFTDSTFANCIILSRFFCQTIINHYKTPAQRAAHRKSCSWRFANEHGAYCARGWMSNGWICEGERNCHTIFFVVVVIVAAACCMQVTNSGHTFDRFAGYFFFRSIYFLFVRHHHLKNSNAPDFVMHFIQMEVMPEMS